MTGSVHTPWCGFSHHGSWGFHEQSVVGYCINRAPIASVPSCACFNCVWTESWPETKCEDTALTLRWTWLVSWISTGGKGKISPPPAVRKVRLFHTTRTWLGYWGCVQCTTHYMAFSSVQVQDTEHENLARAIFDELNDAYARFEESGAQPLY